MILSPETNEKVDQWKRRCLLPHDHPEAMTLDELREAMKHLRGERKEAMQAQSASKKKKEPVDVHKLLEGW